MKIRTFTLIPVLTAIASTVAAGGPPSGAGSDYYDYAKVTDVKPIYRLVRIEEPRRECWDEEVVEHDRGGSSKTPLVLGGIIGGAVGNTIGEGRGKDAATIAGVLLGASIGNDMRKSNRQGQTHVYTRPVCKTVTEYREEERLDGYSVTYRYQGRTYTTRTDQDPGQRMRVQVSVRPVY